MDDLSSLLCVWASFLLFETSTFRLDDGSRDHLAGQTHVKVARDMQTIYLRDERWW